MILAQSNLASSAWASPTLTPSPPPLETQTSQTWDDVQPDQDTNYLPLFWLLDMSRDPCHCYSSSNTTNPYEHPFHVLARHAYNHTAQRERASKHLSASHFAPDFASEIQTCLQVYADGQADYHVFRTRHAHNAVFWTGLRAGHAQLVRVVLAEKRWSVNRWYFARLAEVMVECAHKVRGEIFEGLVADRERFGLEMVERVVVECFQGAGSRKLYWEPDEQVKDWRPVEEGDGGESEQDRDEWRDQQVAMLVDAVLEMPQVNAGLVWERMLMACLDSVVEPKMLCMAGEVVLGGKWQLERTKEAFRRQLAATHPDPVASTGLANRSRRHTLLPTCRSPDPRLVLELPYDIQLQVVDALDFDSIVHFRSTCRQVRDQFPLGRFSQRFLERELLSSARPRFIHSPARLQLLLDCVPRKKGPSTFDYRALVEAVRHLDVDLAMRFLDPTQSCYDSRQSSEPGFVRYVYPWSLHVLLFESDIQSNLAGARRLLLALLTHPDMPITAWILLALAFSKTTKHLLPLDLPSTTTADVDPTNQYLLQLLNHGEFPSTVPDVIRQDMADPTSTTARLIIAFSLTRFTPTHFTHLLKLFPLDAAHDVELRPIYVRSLVRLVPIDALVECGDVPLLAKVFHWMMLELEAGTCGGANSREVVFSVAHRACLKLQQAGSVAEMAGVEERMAAVAQRVEKQKKEGIRKTKEHERKAGGCRVCCVQ